VACGAGEVNAKSGGRVRRVNLAGVARRDQPGVLRLLRLVTSS